MVYRVGKEAFPWSSKTSFYWFEEIFNTHLRYIVEKNIISALRLHFLLRITFAVFDHLALTAFDDSVAIEYYSMYLPSYFHSSSSYVAYNTIQSSQLLLSFGTSLISYILKSKLRWSRSNRLLLLWNFFQHKSPLQTMSADTGDFSTTQLWIDSFILVSHSEHPYRGYLCFHFLFFFFSFLYIVRFIVLDPESVSCTFPLIDRHNGCDHYSPLLSHSWK